MSVSSSKDEESEGKIKAPVPMNTDNRYFKEISIHPTKLDVKITAAQKMQVGYDKENEREIFKEVAYSVPSPFQATKDMTAAMKKLVKHGLILLESNDDAKSYNVTGIKVTGCIEERNATVVLMMRKATAWSDKEATIKTQPFSLFTEGGIPTEDLIKDLKSIFKATWDYMKGKNASKAQLSIFND